MPLLPLLFISVVVAAIASGFFYIGNTQFKDKGLFFATLSIMLSFVAMTFTTLSWYGVVGANLVLYAVIFGVQALRKK
jgi:hypothetical protein